MYQYDAEAIPRRPGRIAAAAPKKFFQKIHVYLSPFVLKINGISS